MKNYVVPGYIVSIDCNNERLETALNKAFSLCCKTDKSANLNIAAIASSAEDINMLVPDWLNGLLEKSPSNPLIVYGPNDQAGVAVTIGCEKYVAWTHLSSNFIMFVCTLPAEENTSGYFQAIINPLLREHYLKHNNLLLHAASLEITPNNGVLLVANSSGGKTTTALSLLRQQAKLVADDLSVLSLIDNRVKAQGITKLLNIREGTLDYYAELFQNQHLCVDLGYDNKTSLNPQNIYGGQCLTRQAIVSTIYFLTKTPGKPERSLLKTADALNRLLLANMFCENQRITGNAISTFSEILARCQVYQLNTGDNPARLGEWLKAMHKQEDWVPV